jgi:hypothetical protein
MPNPVEPEHIVKTVEMCFAELATHLKLIKVKKTRREFRIKCKAVADATDQAISDAVDGNWKCNVQCILNALDDVVNAILPDDDNDDQDLGPIVDSLGFECEGKKNMHSNRSSSPRRAKPLDPPSNIENEDRYIEEEIGMDQQTERFKPKFESIPLKDHRGPVPRYHPPADPLQDYGYTRGPVKDDIVLGTSHGYIHQAEARPSGNKNGYLCRAPAGRRL